MKTSVLDTLGSGIQDALSQDAEVPVLVAPVPKEQLLESLDPELLQRIVDRDALLADAGRVSPEDPDPS